MHINAFLHVSTLLQPLVTRLFSVGAAVLFLFASTCHQWLLSWSRSRVILPLSSCRHTHACHQRFLYFQVWNIILCAISSGRACADGGAWWADAGLKFHVTGSGERQGAIHHKSLPLSTTCFSTNTKQPQLSFSCCPPRLHWPWCVALITNESQPESFTSCSFHHLSAVCGLVEAGCYWVAMVGPTDRHFGKHWRRASRREMM